MPVWGIVLLVIFVILLAVFIGLMIFGNKLRKQQDEQQAQIDAAKQVMSMWIMTLMAYPKVFDQLPVKAEVKAEVSGIYITGIKSVRGGKVVAEPAPKKKGLKKFFSKNK